MVGHTSHSAQVSVGNRMAGSLRGQLGVKSSPLCPTASKLTTQYLVLDHMNNHYKKLSKVKPSIDNTPPKSIAQSQKMRDRFQRSHSSRPGSSNTDRPGSRMMGRSYSALADSDIYDETYWGNPEDEEETNVMSIMKDVLKKPSNDSAPRKGYSGLDKTMGWPQNGQSISRQTVQMPRPTSARSMSSTMAKTGVQAAGAKTTGDVLEKRSHVFTEPDRPFTPRTLKSTRSSRLAEYKYYTPPKKGSMKKDSNDKDVVDGPPQSSLTTMNQTMPTPKPRKRPPSASNRLDVTQDSENTLMFETLQTRDMSRAKPDKTQMVPPLDISVDKDHMNWLQEQASKAQIRVQSARSQKGTSKEGTTGARSSQELRTTGEEYRSFGSTRSWAKDRLSTEEEELKYVEFVKAVTQDVLDRGIFTNRVLLHAFENHIEKNKRQLNERKMRSLLAQLREDLGIPSEREANLDEDNMGHSSRRSSGYRGGELSFERTRTPLKTATYGSAGLQKTGTTAWLSEDGETLRTTKFGETTDYKTLTLTDELQTDTLDQPSYSATLENDGDMLTVTQALETYQLNISNQDSKENHLARDYSNNSVVSEDTRGEGLGKSKPASEVFAVGDTGVPQALSDMSDAHEFGDSRAASEVSRSQKSEGETPRGRRRKHRQAAQDAHNSDGFPDSASQGGDDEKQSVLSQGGQSLKSGAVSPRSQLSKKSQRMNGPRSRRAKKKFGSSSVALAENSSSQHPEQFDENSKHQSAFPNKDMHKSADDLGNGLPAVESKPRTNHISDHGSKFGHHVNGESNANQRFDHQTKSKFHPDAVADGASNADHFPTGNHAADNANADDGDQHGDDDTNADDYEDDVADADDEDATTLTHRTSDDDF